MCEGYKVGNNQHDVQIMTNTNKWIAEIRIRIEYVVLSFLEDIRLDQKENSMRRMYGI